MGATGDGEFRLFDAVSSLVVVVDSEARVVYCNAEFSEVTGWGLAELRGRSLADLLPISDAGEEMLAALHLGSARRIECQILQHLHGRSTNDETPWIVWRISPLEGPERLLVIDGVVRTAHADQQRALRQAKDHLRSSVEVAPYGIFLADRDGRFADVNRAFCRMLGYSRQEMVGKTATDFISPVDVERLAEAKVLPQQSGSHVVEWNLTRKDGTQLPVEVSASFLSDGHWRGFVRDITERKRLAAMLQVTRSELAISRSRLRSVMDHAYQFIGLLAPDGTVLEANRSALRLVAARREDVIGRPFWETPWWADNPEQKRRLRDRIEDAVRNGHFVRFDATHPAADGSTVDVDFSLTPVRDANGQVIYIVPEGRDITDRRRLEHALRRSEARLSRLVSTASDAIISVDEDRRIVLFNRGAEQIFGWKSEEIVRQPLDLLIPVRLRTLHRQHLRDFEKEAPATRSMTDRRAMIFGVRKTGEEFPMEASISTIEVEGKHTFTVILRDISKRAALEREVNRRLEQQSLLARLGATLAEALDYDTALIRVAELVASTMASCSIAYAAKDGEIRRVKVACGDPALVGAAEALERQPVHAMERSAVHSLILSGQPRLVKELSPDALRSLVQNDAYYARLAALEPRSGLAVPLVVRGRSLGALVLFSCNTDRLYGDEDVTLAMLIAERTALSLDVLQLLHAAREASQARDDLLGFVAHDLRNPLAVVDLMVRRIADLIPADAVEAHRGLQMIVRSSARANRLIQELLDLRRPQADLTLASQPLSPRTLIDEVLETQRPLVAAASLTLEIAVPDGLPAVLADRERIARVLENLMGNAVKFTRAGGRISVRAASREEDVLFRVADTGRGVSSGDLPHVFDPFWRGRGTKQGGVGLGLPIARRIIEAHGGNIWVDSQEGAGATVSFTLPKAVAQTPANGGAADRFG